MKSPDTRLGEIRPQPIKGNVLDSPMRLVRSGCEPITGARGTLSLGGVEAGT